MQDKRITIGFFKTIRRPICFDIKISKPIIVANYLGNIELKVLKIEQWFYNFNNTINIQYNVDGTSLVGFGMSIFLSGSAVHQQI